MRYRFNFDLYGSFVVEADSVEEADAIGEAQIIAIRDRIDPFYFDFDMDFLYDEDEYEAEMDRWRAEREADPNYVPGGSISRLRRRVDEAE